MINFPQSKSKEKKKTFSDLCIIFFTQCCISFKCNELKTIHLFPTDLNLIKQLFLNIVFLDRQQSNMTDTISVKKKPLSALTSTSVIYRSNWKLKCLIYYQNTFGI